MVWDEGSVPLILYEEGSQFERCKVMEFQKIGVEI